jgi:hypothetical protein
MNHLQRVLAVVAVVFVLIVGGCPNDAETGENHDSHSHGENEHGEVSRGAHDRDGSEHHGEEGEESGTELALDATYDEVRNGARLILTYNAQSKSFGGTVENTTDKTLERVRVEVHLSNGKELGPTIPADLGPGEKTKVQLMATGQDFTGWTTHAEVGSGEHSHGEEGGEHSDGGESGEHSHGETPGEHSHGEGSHEHN